MALCATWLLWRARGAFSFPVILLFAEGTLVGSWSLGFLRSPRLGVHVTDQNCRVSSGKALSCPGLWPTLQAEGLCSSFALDSRS